MNIESDLTGTMESILQSVFGKLVTLEKKLIFEYITKIIQIWIFIV